MSDDFIRISRLENGYVVSCIDPVQEKKNAKGPAYVSAWKDYAAKDEKAVIALVSEKLGEDDEFGDAYDEATSKK